ncbi:hypothetical protein C8J56DRAFT_955838 [Mycena floridula]|nr:hypothetical protein C8J56DRAFT_955838 [Mycena floridula]
MSIDVQEACKAIRDMAPIINPDEDYLTIVAAEEKIGESDARKRKEIEEAHANLKALTKLLEAARKSSTRPTTVPSEKAHTATLNELDGSKLSISKAISDAEGVFASKEAELAALKDEVRRFEQFDPAQEHEKDLDGNPLRLQIYKGMGFESVMDKNGNVIKMLVRAQSGDVHSVSFDGSCSDFEYTGRLWETASS